MVRIILMVFLVALAIALLFAGKQMVCSKPYMLSGADCCLDGNGNNVCDKDEMTANMTRMHADNCTEMPDLNRSYCYFLEAKRTYSERCAGYCDELSKTCKRSCIDSSGASEGDCISACTQDHRTCVNNCRTQDPVDLEGSSGDVIAADREPLSSGPSAPASSA
jgi:hypothetical protein